MGIGFRDDWRENTLFVLVAAVLVFAGSMVFVQANPGAPWQLESVYSNTVGQLSAASGDDGAEVLKLPVQDAKYLNRVYRELNTAAGDGVGEQAYCVDLVGSRMSIQQAGTIEASESSVTFTTANCYGLLGSPDATLHFHPSGSEPVLSGPETSVNEGFNDKRSLLDSNFKYSCVMAGLVTESPGSVTAALKCYNAPESGNIGDEFPEIKVEVVK